MAIAGLIIESILAVSDNAKLLRKLFPSKFLNYDPNFLCKVYRNERALEGRIPYKEEVNWIKPSPQKPLSTVNNIKIEKIPEAFVLDQDSVQLRSFQGAAYSEFAHSKGLPRDTDVIRLDSLDVSAEETTLRIQKAKYSDQVQSNLVMDWSGDHALKTEMKIETLRGYFSGLYPNVLPPLDDGRLANTIGISVILFYKNKNDFYIPYLPRRSKGMFSKKKILAVHEGGYNCTASGATEWNHSQDSSFDGIFLGDMYREIREEVGIYPEEIKVIVPLALCREFLRGGKPQIFFGGITDLSIEDIANKRKTAIRKQAVGDKIEVEDDQLIINDFDQFKRDLPQKVITLEAKANLYYAESFLNQYLEL